MAVNAATKTRHRTTDERFDNRHPAVKYGLTLATVHLGWPRARCAGGYAPSKLPLDAVSACLACLTVTFSPSPNSSSSCAIAAEVPAQGGGGPAPEKCASNTAVTSSARACNHATCDIVSVSAQPKSRRAHGGSSQAGAG
jgi:hypothetical protein